MMSRGNGDGDEEEKEAKGVGSPVKQALELLNVDDPCV